MVRFFSILAVLSIGACLALLNYSGILDDDDIDVFVSIRPLYGIVYSVTKDSNLKTGLLMDGKISPHLQDLTPKQVNNIKKSKIFISIGESYEHKLRSHRKSINSVNWVNVDQFASIRILKQRFINSCCQSSHHHHDKDVLHSQNDGHLWLDLDNAILIAEEITNLLSEKFPDQKNIFIKNRDVFIKQVSLLKVKLIDKFRDLSCKNYVVYHDCLQYFDRCFGTNCLGTLVDEPDLPIRTDIFKIIAEKKPICVFVEPQFKGVSLNKIAKKIVLPIVEIDYLGIDLGLDDKTYFNIIENLADRIYKGLSKSS